MRIALCAGSACAISLKMALWIATSFVMLAAWRGKSPAIVGSTGAKAAVASSSLQRSTRRYE